MKIKKNTVVALSYVLDVDGEVKDLSIEGHPLEYIHGTNMLLPKFEAEVAGKEPGEEFDFFLEPEEGYGVFNPELCIEIPKSAFEVNGEIRSDLMVKGKIIPMLNQDGQVVQGTVESVNKDSVTMNFNHPLAGMKLHFKGKVESVRTATEKELTEGLHGEYLPQEGCHCHHGGEGCDCHHDGEGCCGEHKEGCCGEHKEGCCHKQ